MRRSAALALLLVLCSCARAVDPGGRDEGSGITGRVVIVGCPVKTTASPCPRRPVSTLVSVESEAGDLHRVRSGSDGRFSIALPPGDYLVGAQPPPGTTYVPGPLRVTVEAGGYRQVTVVLTTRLFEP